MRPIGRGCGCQSSALSRAHLVVKIGAAATAQTVPLLIGAAAALKPRPLPRDVIDIHIARNALPSGSSSFARAWACPRAEARGSLARRPWRHPVQRAASNLGQLKASELLRSHHRGRSVGRAGMTHRQRVSQGICAIGRPITAVAPLGAGLCGEQLWKQFWEKS
jgi:hypothetical protein